TPMDSLRWATKLTPLSACTSWMPRWRLSMPPPPPSLSFLPVARVLYRTWAPSQMTTGWSVPAASVLVVSVLTASVSVASAVVGSIVGSSLIPTVPFLRLPEEDEAEDEDSEGPDGQVPEVIVGDDTVLHQDAAGDREHIVDRLLVGEGLQGGVDLLDHGFELEEDARGVEDHAGDERGDLRQVTEVDRDAGEDERHPLVEDPEQEDQRNEEEPVPVRSASPHDRQQRHEDERGDEVEQVLEHDGDRQNDARERQGLDQGRVADDRFRAAVHRGVEELEDEDADDDEGGEVRRTGGRTLHDVAEDRAVDEGG